MFKNKPLAALVALACAPAALAQTPTQLDAVVVTATRTATPVSKVLSDVTVLGQEEISQSGSLTVAQLLAEQAGVEFYSNGGEGKSSSLMLRGATAKQTLVLIDGMRVLSATAGTTSLENISLDSIERVEILRGPASSLYGADAIGGVVQIFTKRGKGAPALRFNAGVGAEGKRVFGLGFAGEVGQTRFNLGVDHNKTDGISARNADNPKYNADRDGFENTTYTVSAEHQLAAGHSLGFNLYQSEARNEYDQSAKAADESRSRLAGQSVELKNRVSERWTSSLRFINSSDKSRNFTNGNFAVASSQFETRQQEWQWNNQLDLATAGQLTLGANHLLQRVYSSTAYSQNRRTVDALYAGYQGEFGAHRLQGSLRHDDNSQFGGKTTGQIGYGYQLTPSLLLRAAYGTAFKAPTFNDLYWPLAFGYQGNPNLKPEEASNRELAVHWRQGGSHLRVTAFDNHIRNLIAGTADWSTVDNLEKARIIGQTIEAGQQWGNFGLSANLTNQRARDENSGKQLVYRAKLHGGINATLQQDRTRYTAQLTASGQRPTSNANTEFLGGYGVLNLAVEHELARNWTLQGKLSNVTDKRYETTKDYSQPRRGWFVGVRYAQ